MRYLTIVFLLNLTLFANTANKIDVEKSLDKSHLKSLHGKQLSKEEIAYQEYKLRLEEENRKLEEDGFCSCNND